MKITFFFILKQDRISYRSHFIIRFLILKKGNHQRIRLGKHAITSGRLTRDPDLDASWNSKFPVELSIVEGREGGIGMEREVRSL